MKLRYSSPEDAGMSAKKIKHVESLVEKWVDQGTFQSIVGLVVRRGTIVLEKAYGKLTQEPDSPLVEVDSIFPLASVTKLFTVTAAMILVEDGLLSINRPVSEYIPEFIGEKKDKVTVFNLMTHTSGLVDEDIEEYVKKKDGLGIGKYWSNISALQQSELFKQNIIEVPPTEKTQHPEVNEYLFLRYDAPLSIEPYSAMYYCDYNFSLLGEIVRRISGESLDGFCRKRIFKPLGMKDTYYETPDSIKHRIVKRPENAPYAFAERIWVEWPEGSGCAISTVLDMAIFGQTYLNGGIYNGNRILSPISISEMTRDQLPGINARFGDEVFRDASWGLGWGVNTNKIWNYNGILQSSRSFSHSGAGTVKIWVDPVYEIIGCFFSVRPSEPTAMNIDLFMNAVTSAIIDI